MNFIRYIYIIFILILFSGISSAQNENEVLAKIGSDIITVEQFQNRFDFMPHLNYSNSNIDSIKKEFSSPFVKILNVTTYSDTLDSTVHANIELSFNHVDSLNTVNAFSQSRFMLEDGAAGQKVFSQFIPTIATGFGIDGSNYHVTYNYDIRGDIITHNATDKSGNYLTWSYSLDEIGRGKTISVTFKPYKLKETPYWIYILAGLVLLIVAFFLVRKKKD